MEIFALPILSVIRAKSVFCPADVTVVVLKHKCEQQLTISKANVAA